MPVIYFTGFGYPTTHDGLGSLPSAFIERVARKLGEKGRSADSAILPFLCYTFVPKCRINGDVSNIRPCRDACDKLEVSVTQFYSVTVLWQRMVTMSQIVTMSQVLK